jgi:hypothetical protein
MCVAWRRSVNEAIKAGKTSEGWQEKPAKNAQKDKDARRIACWYGRVGDSEKFVCCRGWKEVSS